MDAAHIMVVADASQIHQIIMNLCTNAAHAMEGKNGFMEVGLKSVRIENWEQKQIKGLAPGNFIELSITDSGCGIPELVIERIYEPFFTTKAKGQGTGMGLSIVHGIVKDMGAFRFTANLARDQFLRYICRPVPVKRNQRSSRGCHLQRRPAGFSWWMTKKILLSPAGSS